jgi:hypothetical protein
VAVDRGDPHSRLAGDVVERRRLEPRAREHHATGIEDSIPNAPRGLHRRASLGQLGEHRVATARPPIQRRARQARLACQRAHRERFVAALHQASGGIGDVNGGRHGGSS